MRQFEFSLQKVLDYRRMVEDWAKKAYLEAHAKHLGALDDLAAISQRRIVVLETRPETVEELLTLERYLVRLEDEERAQHSVIAILIQEEESALAHWNDKRHEAEALERLREKQHHEWMVECDREEQKALDEWSVMRRKAA